MTEKPDIPGKRNEMAAPSQGRCQAFWCERLKERS